MLPHVGHSSGSWSQTFWMSRAQFLLRHLREAAFLALENRRRGKLLLPLGPDEGALLPATRAGASSHSGERDQPVLRTLWTAEPQESEMQIPAADQHPHTMITKLKERKGPSAIATTRSLAARSRLFDKTPGRHQGMF